MIRAKMASVVVGVAGVMWCMAFSVNAGEPLVQEKTLPDGLTELRVVSDAGKDLAVYKVDLKTRHEPATDRTGNIKAWETWRYGGFFCFNDNQFTGEEFSKNRDAKLFNPSKLDIAGWAKTMKNAGMKYAVLTTRHTSGFLLWDSPTSEFDVGSSPGKPDVAGEFVKECRKAGIAPAFYYCLWGGKNWMPHPNAREIILAQINELATKFGEIPYFWIDMGIWRTGNLSIQEIYDLIKNAQPNAIVIMSQAIQNGRRLNFFPTDVINGEVVVPPAEGHQPLRTVNGKQYYLPFEFEPVSQRISKGTTTPLGAVGAWFTYGDGKGFEVSKPIETKVLFDWIKQAYDRGAANVLLSLAADYTGKIRPDDVKQLEELGKMLKEASLLEDPKAAVQPVVSPSVDRPAKTSGTGENNIQQDGTAMAFVWPSAIPADCPFLRSPTLTGISFTGRNRGYRAGDTWYPCWASDDKLYSPWTDGGLEGMVSGSSHGEKAKTGHAVMIGDDPLKLEIHNTSPPKTASARPYQGRYPCGSLVLDGIWYYGTYCLGPEPGDYTHNGLIWNWPYLGPMPGFQISRDYGKTWESSPLTPDKPLFPEPAKYLGPVKMGAPHFVDFGKNMEHSPDGKAYLLGMGAEENDPQPRPCLRLGAPGQWFEINPDCKENFSHANLSWISADQVYLSRVKPSPETINDIKAYEFFAGHDANGRPVWTSDFAKIKPLLEWNNHLGCVTATWVPGLKKYLMCVTDGWPTMAKMTSYILEADVLTGPWRMVTYMKDFGEQGFFLNFPSKFISADGRTLWLCYSANFSSGMNGQVLKLNPPGGRGVLRLHEVKLMEPTQHTNRQ